MAVVVTTSVFRVVVVEATRHESDIVIRIGTVIGFAARRREARVVVVVRLGDLDDLVVGLSRRIRVHLQQNYLTIKIYHCRLN